MLSQFDDVFFWKLFTLIIKLVFRYLHSLYSTMHYRTKYYIYFKIFIVATKFEQGI